MITTAEWRLVAIDSELGLPLGGQELLVRIESGSHSAETWTSLFGPIFTTRLGVKLYPGSLNLRSDYSVEWDTPLCIQVNAINGEFCPIILNERAIGVAFRGNRETPALLEVLAPVNLRDRLSNARDGDEIRVRLLSGRFLHAAA
jgi:hypothetical protein